jgi:hypothetical protein
VEIKKCIYLRKNLLKMKLLLFFLSIVFLAVTLSFGQSQGPNSPGSQSNSGAGNNWSDPGNISASDDNRAVISSAGLSSDLIGQDYGFSLLNTDVVTGIELEIERSATLGDPISLVGSWGEGENSAISNFNLGAGSNRTLILFIGAENGDSLNVSSVTYGGRPMTRLLRTSYQTSFWAHTECWYMNETELSQLTDGNNYNIQVSYHTFTNDEFFDILSAALFDNVDQGSPFFSNIQRTVDGATPNPMDFGANITAGNGGMFLTNIFCGNNTTPQRSNGGTNTFTISNSFTEGHDRYRSSSVAPNSGGCMQSAYKLAPVGGTENPEFTFAGSANRRLAIGIGLRKVSTIDEDIRLLKNGVIAGNNQASTSEWSTADQYVTYGGPGDLWGTTWNAAEINNSLFGSSMAVEVFNGTARVDHMRITVYTLSTLPVELIDFYASKTENRTVMTNWLTGSELNSDYFEIERSADGYNFESIGEIKAAGNSSSLLTYQFEDKNPLNGVAYYRLKQVDFDGTFEYSDIKSIEIEGNNALIYPNPVSDWAKIAVNNENVTVSIVSSTGQVIDTHPGYFFNDDYHFNVSNHPDGVYYLIVNDFGNVTTKAFVKQTK